MGSKKDKAILAALFDLTEASKGARLGRYGCQTIPKDAQVEVLKRFPSSFQFVRLVKVNVTFTPNQFEDRLHIRNQSLENSRLAGDGPGRVAVPRGLSCELLSSWH